MRTDEQRYLDNIDERKRALVSFKNTIFQINKPLGKSLKKCEKRRGSNSCSNSFISIFLCPKFRVNTMKGEVRSSSNISRYPSGYPKKRSFPTLGNDLFSIRMTDVFCLFLRTPPGTLFIVIETSESRRKPRESEVRQAVSDGRFIKFNTRFNRGCCTICSYSSPCSYNHTNSFMPI